MEEKKQDEKLNSVLSEAEEAENNVEAMLAMDEELPEAAAEAEAVLDAAEEVLVGRVEVAQGVYQGRGVGVVEPPAAVLADRLLLERGERLRGVEVGHRPAALDVEGVRRLVPGALPVFADDTLARLVELRDLHGLARAQVRRLALGEEVVVDVPAAAEVDGEVAPLLLVGIDPVFV